MKLKHVFASLPLCFALMIGSTLSAAASDPVDVAISSGCQSHQQFDYCHAAFLVDLLYQGVLFRGPNPTELSQATRKVLESKFNGLVTLAQEIGNSGEFANVIDYYGLEVMIEHTYRIWLHRAPDRKGYLFWIDRFHTFDQATTLSQMLNSAEFVQRNITPWTN